MRSKDNFSLLIGNETIGKINMFFIVQKVRIKMYHTLQEKKEIARGMQLFGLKI